VGGDTDVLNSEKFLPVKPVIYIVKNQSGTWSLNFLRKASITSLSLEVKTSSGWLVKISPLSEVITSST
jgi:hypothetical protein